MREDNSSAEQQQQQQVQNRKLKLQSYRQQISGIEVDYECMTSNTIYTISLLPVLRLRIYSSIKPIGAGKRVDYVHTNISQASRGDIFHIIIVGGSITPKERALQQCGQRTHG